jgi:hypothetical protein
MMRALPFLLYSNLVLAHPGHGEPGLLHSHGEWIMLVIALILWRALRR